MFVYATCNRVLSLEAGRRPSSSVWFIRVLFVTFELSGLVHMFSQGRPQSSQINFDRKRFMPPLPWDSGPESSSLLTSSVSCLLSLVFLVCSECCSLFSLLMNACDAATGANGGRPSRSNQEPTNQPQEDKYQILVLCST